MGSSFKVSLHFSVLTDPVNSAYDLDKKHQSVAIQTNTKSIVRVQLWSAFVLKPLCLFLLCVCVCFLKKKKKSIVSGMLT